MPVAAALVVDDRVFSREDVIVQAVRDNAIA
jgi:hypothetical protein